MKALTNWRYYVLFAIAVVAVVGMFAIPEEDVSFGEWAKVMLISKSVGISAIVMFFALVRYWDRKSLTKELSKLVKED